VLIEIALEEIVAGGAAVPSAGVSADVAHTAQVERGQGKAQGLLGDLEAMANQAARAIVAVFVSAGTFHDSHINRIESGRNYGRGLILRLNLIYTSYPE
jgi:hypothetical protein